MLLIFSEGLEVCLLADLQLVCMPAGRGLTVAQPSSILGHKDDWCSNSLCRATNTGAMTFQGTLPAAVHCIVVTS